MMVDRQNGMTLVEVLVALAVMSAVAAAILALIAQNTRFLAAAETRMIAGMAADVQMVDALARRAPLERGLQQSVIDFAGRRFLAVETVTETGVDELVRIDILIQDADGRQSLASATSIKSEQ